MPPLVGAGHAFRYLTASSMPSQRTSIHLAAVALFTLLVGYAQLGGFAWMQQAELSMQDRFMRFGRPAQPDSKFVFLARDTASANLDGTDLNRLFDLTAADADSRRALDLMVHEWPWSREVYAIVLDRLIRAGARAVAFDFTFPKPSPDDEAFRDSLARHQDRVVVAGNITEDFEGAAFVFGVPTATLVPETSPRDSRIGFDNFWPEADGIVRKAQFRWAVQYGVWQSREESSLAARTLEKAGFGASVPTGQESYRPRLAGPPGTFRPFSIHEIFVPKYWRSNYKNGGFFKDKIVIVGASGNWQHDEHQTALGLMTGAEIQMNAMNAALHGDFLREVSWPVSLALCALAGLVGLACSLCRASPLLHMGLAGVSGALWVGTQTMLFDNPGVFIPVVGPLSILSATGLFSIGYDLVSVGAERLRLRRTIIERKRAEEILQSTNAELERRVEERTAELSRSNASLTSLVDEKNVLLKEVHHRVKNNLQIISSLLNLQSGHIQDPAALVIFNESRNRVRSMALIHEKLYQSQDLAKIDFQDYLRALTSGLQASFAGKSSQVRMLVEVEEIMLGVDSAVPCGLIVNELVTNCFKYAFAEQSGEISISMKRAPEARLRLTVSDNGVGFPKDLDFRNTESLGMQLVTTLAEQLDGTIAMRNGTGTTFEISFPETYSAKL